MRFGFVTLFYCLTLHRKTSKKWGDQKGEWCIDGRQEGLKTSLCNSRISLSLNMKH